MTESKKKEEKKVVVSYTKEQLISSKKYKHYIDFLSGVLEDSKTYTLEKVDALIKKYYGKKGE